MTEFKKRLLKRCKRGLVTGAELGYLERIPTGIAGLDSILGGGLPVGRVMQIWGPESTGKSALSLSIIRGCQIRNPEGNYLYVDAEMTITQEDLDAHKIDKNRLVFYRPVGGEDAIDTALDALMEGAEVAVIDSIPYLRPKKVLDEMLKDSTYRDVSSIAGMLERLQSKIIVTLEQCEGTLIFINQQRPSKDMYSLPSHPGGSALKFMQSISVHVTSAKKDKNNPDCIVQNLITSKNKTYTPLRTTSLVLNNREVNRGRSLLDTSIAVGLVVQKGGGYISLSQAVADALGIEPGMPRTLEASANFLNSEPKIFNYLYEQVLTIVKSGKDTATLDEEQEVEEAADIYEDN